jgi:hypothetical protein
MFAMALLTAAASLSTHQWKNGLRKCDRDTYYTMELYSAIKK